MKLATLNDGSRDGQLVVVSRDLMSAHYATGVADHLQQVLEDWNFFSPQLQDLYDTLNQGKARHAFAFDPRLCLAPLPRAYLFAKGDAYAGTRAAESRGEPLHLMFADTLIGPCAPLRCDKSSRLPDFEAAIAVITGDLVRDASAAQALDSVRLLMLVSHAHWRGLGWPENSALGALPFSAFSPVAVTPDELVWAGDSAWSGGRLNLTLECRVNGRKLGLCDAGSDMVTPFGELVAALSQWRDLRSGSIISCGEVRSQDAGRGCCSIAAKRLDEMAQFGGSTTPWLTQGDQVVIDMKGRDGQSVFGVIDQQVQIGAQSKPSDT